MTMNVDTGCAGKLLRTVMEGTARPFERLRVTKVWLKVTRIGMRDPSPLLRMTSAGFRMTSGMLIDRTRSFFDGMTRS